MSDPVMTAEAERIEVEPTSAEKRATMDWESFFASYREPDFIPGFQIVNKLGSGVFGEVYKARKTSIGKLYAIKFLKVSDEKIGEAIIKELDSLRFFAQLDHPNLVTIEDKGEVMGIPYIVMGYAGDETLKKRLSTGSLDEDSVREIFGQLAAGVAALHEKSIIHFDLKPANVFMRGNHARIGDYGLSKLVSESHKTMSMGRGTPYYMAPEMLRRKGDHRSDIYSLGVILYEMVAGHVPFDGDSEWEVLKKHETEAVIVPPEVSSLFRTVIKRAMEKDPTRRYTTVHEMIEALGTATVGSTPVVMPVMPIMPPPLPSAEETAPPVGERDLRRHMHAIMKDVQKRDRNRAEEARRRFAPWELARRPRSEELEAPRGFGSFYADFDGAGASAATDQPAGSPAQVGRAIGDAAAKAKQAAHNAADAAKRGAQEAAAVAQKAMRDAAVMAREARYEQRRADHANRPWYKKPLLWPVYLIASPFVLIAFVLKWFGLGVAKVGRLAGRLVTAFLKNFVRYTIVLAITAGLVLLVHGALRGFNL